MNSPFSVDPNEFREAIAASCLVTDTIGDPGKVADALVTFSHAKAPDYRTPLVRGGSGSGKSFWWAALQLPAHRKWIANSLGTKMAHVESLQVIPGFGVASSEKYPSGRTLAELAAEHPEHLEDVWTTVVLHQLLDPKNSPYSTFSSWKERVAWTAGNVEKSENLLRIAALDIEQKNAHLLIVFDGLDRLASSWEKIRPLAQSILRFALQVQSYPRIRAKVFLRPDMFDDPAITAFPDASKLKDNHARLEWKPLELFALFFQRLGNAENGNVADAFRNSVAKTLSDNSILSPAWEEKDGVWSLPARLRSDSSAQREVFHSITGRAMSHNQNSVKRGYPYSWLPNHLADSHGEISPRSFLAALRKAAGIEPPQGFNMPLYFTGIQQGVSAASQTRVDEISEDYEWVREVMRFLNGKVNVPCEVRELFEIWQVEQAMAKVEALDSAEESPKVGPINLGSNALDGLLDNLVRLGIFSRRRAIESKCRTYTVSLSVSVEREEFLRFVPVGISAVLLQRQFKGTEIIATFFMTANFPS